LQLSKKFFCRSSVIEVVLKIVERRLDNGEREYRVEISRPDEFEFLYGEGITRTKYQNLAKTWNLNVDFDDFPARIVRLLRERSGASSPVQLTCTLSQDLSVCTFEMVHIIDMYTVRMPIDLKAVRDKELLCHVINNMRSLQKQMEMVSKQKKHVERECEELKQIIDELREFRVKSEQKTAELEHKVLDAERRIAEETLRREEFEQDLQLERDERDSALNTIEHLKNDLSEAEKKARELEEELIQCEEECEDLVEKLRDSERSSYRLQNDKESLTVALDKAKKDLGKANHVIFKYLKGEFRSQSQRSLDESKDEMAADLKMKESLIEDMTVSIADYKKKVDDLITKNRELQDTLQVMEAERARNARVIEMYRNQHRSAVSSSIGTSPIYSTFPSPLVNGQNSPLLACVPATPSNFRNVLGRTLQSSTALATPSMRTTPPLLDRRYLNATDRENVPPIPGTDTLKSQTTAMQ
uniref:SAS-6_N domain-containing protein n=1 Tax=Angiostrongylus cantonensis TaxID=6313 RepID=A0A0K0DHT0_ANGCA